MAISDHLQAAALETLRQKYRPAHPEARLIGFVDGRSGSPIASFVVAIDKSSAWYELLPEEQIVELRDRERPE